MSDQKKQSKRRRLIGVVVSDKMDKTVVVRVDNTVVHSKYLKRFTKSKKFKAHDPENQAKTGDKVTIEETRPISKGKTWRIVTKQS
ncbi:30S ribosomal protein S17 [Candidatus Uhrbacteria bacterium]|jgi:small subunit ribosomal protein S17|nr:30S ribosomal protein S17 [Candidatus Uhrbacteria bacterium]